MSSQTHTLHRSLLRPTILHTLRAAGFHSTKPAVLDTLVNLAERYLILLASTTASHARNTHNDPVPTISDVRLALQDCGALIPVQAHGREEWSEVMRRPVEGGGGGQATARASAEKRKREEEDVGDVRAFATWFDGPVYGEIRRVAGLVAEGESSGGAGAGAGGAAGVNDAGAAAPTAAPVVGVGGSVVQVEDFLTALKRKYAKSGAGGAAATPAGMEDARWVGTVLGRSAEERSVLLEGGPVQRIREWRPPRGRTVVGGGKDETEGRREEDVDMDDSSSLSTVSSATLVRDDFVAGA